ncbi:MAG: barstar family protein [Dorea sp.]
MMRYILDADFMKTKEDVHTYLKEQLELPEYYGANLDALYDCLTEQDDIEIEIINMPEEKSSYVWKVWKVVKRAKMLVE